MTAIVEQVKSIYHSVGMNVPIVMASSPVVGAFLAPILAHTETLNEKTIKTAQDHAKRLLFTKRKALIKELIDQYADALSHASPKPRNWVSLSQPGSTNTAFLRAWREFRDKSPLPTAPPFLSHALADFVRGRINTLWGRRVKYHPMLWLHSTNYLMWPNKRFAVISAPPVHVLQNNNLQLHSTTDLAVKWSDGWGVAMVNGTMIPSRYILYRNLLTVDVINKTSNVEVKRALMELYGFERWLTDTKATLLHSDLDQDGRPRRLWQLMSTSDRILINLLEVFNSTPELEGHYKKYFLQVPGNITPTVTAALQWMLDDERQWDVNPLIET